MTGLAMLILEGKPKKIILHLAVQIILFACLCLQACIHLLD